LPEGLGGRSSGRKQIDCKPSLKLGTRIGPGNYRPDHPRGLAALSILIHQPVQLGTGTGERERIKPLLLVTLILSVITLGTSRTTVLQGIVHLVVFAVFLFFAFVP